MAEKVVQERKRKNSAPTPANVKAIRSSSGRRPLVSSQPAKRDKTTNDRSSNNTTITTTDLIKPCGVCSKREFNNAINENNYCFTCTVCCECFHGSCLNFDQSSLSLIAAVFQDIPWSCDPCLETARRSKLKGKCKITNVEHSSNVAMESEIESLRKRVASLEDTVNCLLSGISSLDPVSWPSLSQSLNSSASTSIKLSSNEVKAAKPLASSLLAPSKVNLPLTDVLSAVHTEMIDVTRRRENLIIYGLSANDNKNDAELFEDLCRNHLDLDHPPVVRVTRRLGKPKPGKIQHLLVTLAHVADVAWITSVAKNLRKSSDPSVRSGVFINKDMTKSEAKAAFELREKRRLQHRVQSNKSATSSISAAMETEIVESMDVVPPTPIPSLSNLVSSPPAPASKAPGFVKPAPKQQQAPGVSASVSGCKSQPQIQPNNGTTNVGAPSSD